MKKIGFLAITLGFLAGAYVAVLDKNEVSWLLFAFAALIGIIGIILARMADRQETQSVEKLSEDIKTVHESLGRLVENAQRLAREGKEMNPYDVLPRIDECFPEDFNAFVQARKSMIHVYDLQIYAEVMTEFAAGERYLNRVWSAAADGYVDEVRAYLDKTHFQLSLAYDKLKAAEDQMAT